MHRIDRPTKAQIGQIAENQPALLNVLVAYFVMEWREVRVTEPPHGVDQKGVTDLIPDYVEMLGVDACVSYLLACDPSREPEAPGLLSRWLTETAYVD